MLHNMIPLAMLFLAHDSTPRSVMLDMKVFDGTHEVTDLKVPTVSKGTAEIQAGKGAYKIVPVVNHDGTVTDRVNVKFGTSTAEIVARLRSGERYVFFFHNGMQVDGRSLGRTLKPGEAYEGQEGENSIVLINTVVDPIAADALKTDQASKGEKHDPDPRQVLIELKQFHGTEMMMDPIVRDLSSYSATFQIGDTQTVKVLPYVNANGSVTESLDISGGALKGRTVARLRSCAHYVLKQSRKHKFDFRMLKADETYKGEAGADTFELITTIVDPRQQP